MQAAVAETPDNKENLPFPGTSMLEVAENEEQI